VQIDADGALVWVAPMTQALVYGRTKKETRIVLKDDGHVLVLGVYSVVATFGNGAVESRATTSLVYGDIYVTKVRFL
jgi:hypothetical protein